MGLSRGPTWPPSAWAWSWPPRQMPMTGNWRSWACLIRAASDCIQGSLSMSDVHRAAEDDDGLDVVEVPWDAETRADRVQVGPADVECKAVVAEGGAEAS